MAIRRTISVTSSSSGAVTAYIPETNGEFLQGKIYTVHYTRETLSTAADFTITTEAHSETVWSESNVNASKTVYPRRTINTTTGGSTTAREPVVVGQDRLKIVVASGGDGGTAKFSVVTDG